MKLTERKLEVLRLIVNGKSNGQIALIRGISINTVGVHRASIMKDMGVHKPGDWSSALFGTHSCRLVDARRGTQW